LLFLKKNKIFDVAGLKKLRTFVAGKTLNPNIAFITSQQ